MAKYGELPFGISIDVKQDDNLLFRSSVELRTDTRVCGAADTAADIRRSRGHFYNSAGSDAGNRVSSV